MLLPGIFAGFSVVTGIHFQILADGSYLASFCSVSRKNKTLDIVSKGTGIKDMEALANCLPSKAQLSVCIDGAGIIHKLSSVSQVDSESFTAVLPGAVYSQFYAQRFPVAAGCYISAARRQLIDELLDRLEKAGFVTFMLSFGPFPVDHVLEQVNFYDQNFVFAGYSVQRDEQLKWLSYQFNEENKATFPVKIQSELIEEELLLPYASAFQLLLIDGVDAVEAEATAIKDKRRDALEYGKLRTAAVLFLVFVFGGLIINFVLFFGLYQSNIRLSEQLTFSATSMEQADKLNAEITRDENELTGIGFEKSLLKSIMIDRVSACMPAGVVVKEVSVNPLNNAGSRAGQAFVFDNHTLYITGNSNKIGPVNDWIMRIRDSKWVKGSTLESYSYDEPTASQLFTIKISY